MNAPPKNYFVAFVAFLLSVSFLYNDSVVLAGCQSPFLCRVHKAQFPARFLLLLRSIFFGGVSAVLDAFEWCISKFQRVISVVSGRPFLKAFANAVFDVFVFLASAAAFFGLWYMLFM